MTAGTVMTLTGGVGGAKFVSGLADIYDTQRLINIVNTGDDFEHLGLHISPDIDTLIYTLSGLADPSKGWGRADETWNFMSALSQIEGEDWFLLGDKDLAIHVERTQRLKQGQSLSAITQSLANALGAPSTILPMSEQRVSTMVETDIGLLSFQDYFVRHQCAPKLKSISFKGVEEASPAKGVMEAFEQADLDAIFIAPSNPWLSIDPILSIAEIKEALCRASAPVIAITPLPGGQAVKGPTAKIMGEFAIPQNLASIIEHYADILDGIVIDMRDEDVPENLPYAVCDTIMISQEKKKSVAQTALDFARTLKS